jgi:hypothetical protein
VRSLEQSFALRDGGYRREMNAQRTVAVRTGYYARPGRRAIVLSDLASLRGPSRGTVELALRLYWSGPSPVFDLADPDMRRWLYQIVLREASRPEDPQQRIPAMDNRQPAGSRGVVGALDGGQLIRAARAGGRAP